MSNKYKLTTLYIYHGVCNQKCVHCWVVPLSENKNFKIIDFKYIKKAIEDCLELGLTNVKITGGEPLLIPYFSELLYFLNKKGLKTWIETNGTLINDEIVKILKDTNTFISISLDSINPRKHNNFRKMKNAFDKTVNAMNLLKREGLNFQVITSLSIFNQEEIEDIINFAFSKGAKSVKINIILPMGRGKSMEKRGELLSIKKVLKIYERIYEKFIKNGAAVIYDIPSAFLHVKSLLMKGKCGILNLLSILTDGTISICGIGNTVEELRLGNVVKNNLKNIWLNHPVLKELREIVPYKLEGICRRCIFKNEDFGACRANVYYITKDFKSPYPFCQKAYNEGLFPKNKIIEGFQSL